MRRETHRRTLVKSFTWRVIATLTTIAIVYVLTGNMGIASAAGFIEVILKLIIYYTHERVWVNIKWGVKNDDS